MKQGDTLFNNMSGSKDMCFNSSFVGSRDILLSESHSMSPVAINAEVPGPGMIAPWS